MCHSGRSSLSSLTETRGAPFGFGKVSPKFNRRASWIIASESRRFGVGRISGMCRIVDLDAVLLDQNLPIEIGGDAIALGDEVVHCGDAPFQVGRSPVHLARPFHLRFAQDRSRLVGGA
jgi:hypothetical protein